MPALLDAKRVLITGGSRGLGRALACVFAGEGARVAFSYTRDEDGARTTLDAIRSSGADGKSYKASVLDVAATEAMVRDLEESWGGIDVLVNNAGVSQNLPIALMGEEDWDRVMDINVKGTFLTSRAVLRVMIRDGRGGVILNVGSLAGTRMIEAPVHYCASKAAINGLTQAMAKEVARHGVRVICLAPGLLEDGVGRNLPEHRLAAYLKHCALGRVGSFDEVARFAAFLASDANGYMSGETVLMDGGL
jgi:NAD(P)-dependent dehydrogenase (short-subunit alcohol dehydrogenase family)